MSTDEIITLGVATLTMGRWVWDNYQKQKWDKNVFLIEKIEKFEALDSTKTMHKILDWTIIDIMLNGKEIEVNDDIICKAFETHDKRFDYTIEESQLRTMFDEYFDNLTKLIILADTKIVDKNKLIIILGYWFRILNGVSRTKPETLIKNIDRYLEFYGFTQLKYFLKTIKRYE